LAFKLGKAKKINAVALKVIGQVSALYTLRGPRFSITGLLSKRSPATFYSNTLEE